MKGVGWETEGCLNITQAKKAGELLSDVSPCMSSYFLLKLLLRLVMFHPFFFQFPPLRTNTARRLIKSSSRRWPTICPSNTPRRVRSCRAMYVMLHFFLLPLLYINCLKSFIFIFLVGIQSKHRANNPPVHHDKRRAPFQTSESQRWPTQCSKLWSLSALHLFLS